MKPFGVTNSTIVFMDFMSCILQPYLDQFVVIFIDEILIYSRDLQEHEADHQVILSILRDKKPFSKFGMCEFWMSKANFLGHVISQGDMVVDPSKGQY